MSNLKHVTTFLSLATLCFSLVSTSFAQAETKPAEQAAKTQAPEVKKDPKTEEYEKAVKDLKKLEGHFTLYQRKKEILLELPEDKLNQLLLVQPTFHSGLMPDSITAGFPLTFGAIDAFKLIKNDETIMFVRPNLKYRWDSQDQLALASSRSFPDATLATFRIEATNPDRKVMLVNISNLFNGDVFRLTEMVQMILGGPYSMERDKSGPEFVKTYPENAVVRMNLMYSNPRPSEENPLLALLGMAAPQFEDGRSAPIKVTYNFWWREKSDYMPRIADQRVGFFTQDYFDVGRFNYPDRTERYINRWNLKKKDPTAELSEPVKPIVWVIDPSIPPQFREATKEGILYWNEAFEALGYKNAVQVKDAPTDPDWDHADGRYNVVRWTMSEDAAYAIALMRTDPFTGQIYNAAVNFDANIAFFSDQEYKNVAIPSATGLKRAFDVLTTNWRAAHDHTKCEEEAFLFDGELAAHKSNLKPKLSKYGWFAHDCNYAQAKTRFAAEGWEALMASPTGFPKVAKDQYVKDFIKDVTSHEVGHCMGLRHNFISSKMNSTQDLGNETLIRSRGITSSVMEYTPTNAIALLKGSGVFFAPKVGPYDVWAIKYGYMDVANANSPQSEKFALSQVAKLSNKPEHRFMTDENADTFDPSVVRFDLASNTLDYLKANLELQQRVRQYAIRNLPTPGEGYQRRTNLIMNSVVRAFREGRLALRFVGGLNGSRSFAGDGSVKALAPVSPAEHRQATQLIARYCLRADAFAMPESVLNSLALDHTTEEVTAWTAPLRQLISTNQAQMVAGLLGASKVNSINENVYKWGSNSGAYSLSEHYSTVLGAVFADLSSSSISTLRRDLHRFTVNALMTQASAPAGAISEDARLLANDSLRRLLARYRSAKSNDQMTATYLRETRAQIERFLSRSVSGN